MRGLNRPAVAPSTRPVHVLEVLGNAIVGGMETWVERLVDRLAPEQFRITALSTFESPLTDRLRAHGVPVHVLPMPEQVLWSSVHQTRNWVEALDIDILHAHLPNAHLLAGLAGHLSGRPVLTTVHGRELSPLDLEIHRAVSSHLSTVCAHSHALACGLGLVPHLLSCEPNGVDAEVFQPRRSGGSLHREFHLHEGTPLVGFVGRLSPEKGPEVFVQSVLRWREIRPDAHAVFIGDGPLRNELTEWVTSHGLCASVHFAGIRMDMPPLYNELDVVVCSSHSEAMPLAVLEAMASAVPVVATRVGGVDELVHSGHTGWLVEPGDPQGIAQCVAQLLNEPQAARIMGERARAQILMFWTLDDSVARVAQLLTRLARSHGAVAPQPTLRPAASTQRPAPTQGRGRPHPLPSGPTKEHHHDPSPQPRAA